MLYESVKQFLIRIIVCCVLIVDRLKKVVCFTRSSPLIHELPHQYPTSSDLPNSSISREIIERLVFNPEQIFVRKLVTVSSQADIQNGLENVLTSSSTRVCLLIGNMQHVSASIINQVRVMLEEIERTLANHNTNKVVMLLLCVTPKQFFFPPYPTLFLNGWEYYYLESVQPSASLNIQDWLKDCLQVGPPQKTFLLKALEEMLPNAITCALSNVTFGCKAVKRFNSMMSLSQRRKLLEDILLRKQVYAVLCEKFCSLWNPSIILHYMQEAARISMTRKSTVSMAESIEHTYKKYFLDFFAYMLSVINEEWYLDILCDEQYDEVILAPFKNILRELPTPPLSQLSRRRVMKNIKYTPIFPFFMYIRDEIDMLLEFCKKKASEEHVLPGRSDLLIVSSNEELFKKLVEELTVAVKVSKLEMK